MKLPSGPADAQNARLAGLTAWPLLVITCLVPPVPPVDSRVTSFNPPDGTSSSGFAQASARIGSARVGWPGSGLSSADEGIELIIVPIFGFALRIRINRG